MNIGGVHWSIGLFRVHRKICCLGVEVSSRRFSIEVEVLNRQSTSGCVDHRRAVLLILETLASLAAHGLDIVIFCAETCCGRCTAGRLRVFEVALHLGVGEIACAA
jgi:hypothetical protein